MRQQIANLIISGSSREQILSIVGISSEALDEIIKDKEFSKQIKEIREIKKEEEIEKELANLELNTVRQVKEAVNGGLLDAVNLCRVMETVARTRQLKKAQVSPLPNNGILHPTISVNVPVFLGNSSVVMDSKKQVVAIDGRNMAPLPNGQVRQLFSTLNGDKNEDDSGSAPNSGTFEGTSQIAAA